MIPLIGIKTIQECDRWCVRFSFYKLHPLSLSGDLKETQNWYEWKRTVSCHFRSRLANKRVLHSYNRPKTSLSVVLTLSVDLAHWLFSLCWRLCSQSLSQVSSHLDEKGRMSGHTSFLFTEINNSED